MNVAVLTSAHPAFDPRIYGKEARSLARAGHRVTVIAPADRDGVVDGVTIRAVPRRHGRLARLTRTGGDVYRLARRLDADVYHFHDPELMWVAWALRRHGKKTVYDIHEDLPRQVLSKPYLPRWSRRAVSCLTEWLEPRGARRCSALVAAEPVIARRFHEVGPRLALVQNFPLVEELRSAIPAPWRDRDPAVAYVGGITQIRGATQMVEAMDLVEAPVRLALAGTFAPEGLRTALRRSKGWSRVDAVGYLDRPAVASLLGRVRAGLVVLRPEPKYIEAQPTKLFEYMAASLPVIASDFPGWREIVERVGCGFLVDPMDPAAIARAIDDIMSHPCEAEAMGRRGRQAIEREYNWGPEEAKLLALYRELAGE
jgi:glycosyltransferase involved in cell wall biosynthesis